MGAAATVVVLAAPVASADSIPANATDISYGTSQFDGHLNQTESVWFKLSGNDTDCWWTTVSSYGATGQMWIYFSDNDNASIWPIPGIAPLFGYSGTSATDWKQPFYNGTPYFLRLTVWPNAANASVGLDFSIDMGVAPIPLLADGGGADVRVTNNVGFAAERPLFFVLAAAGDEVELQATIGAVTQAPAGGPGVTLSVLTTTPLYGRYDDFPLGWNKGLWGGRSGEFWSFQLLNFTACQGIACTTVTRFVAPHAGAFLVRVGPVGGSMDAAATITLTSRVASASRDGNDQSADAQDLYHRPFVVGNLSWGTDAIDWFKLNLTAGNGVSFVLTLTDPQVYTVTKPGVYSAGTLKFLYEIAFLAPNGSRLVAGAVNEVAGEIGGLSTVTLTVAPGLVTANGTYLLKVAVITSGEPTLPVYSPASYATYNISVTQPNRPPVAVVPPAPPSGPEDLQLAVPLDGLFADPESDPVDYAIISVPFGTSAFVQRVNGTTSAMVTPAANFNGNLTVAVKATDWFGASVTSSIVLSFWPVNDPPRLNGTFPLGFAVWNQGNVSSNLSFQLFFVDPDGDLLSLALLLPGEIEAVSCGSMCAAFGAASPDYFGNGTITVVASDPSGLSASGGFSFTIIHVNRPPAPLPGPPPTVRIVASRPGVVVGASAVCADPDGDPLSLSFQGSNAPLQSLFGEPVANGSAGGDLNVSATMEGDAGVWTMFVHCEDPSGLWGAANLSVEVLRPPHAPQLARASPLAAPQTTRTDENATVVFSAYITDADADPLSYAWMLDGILVGGAVANFTTIAFNFTSAGAHLVRLNVSDPGGLSIVVEWNVQVANLDRPPVCVIRPLEDLDGPAGAFVGFESDSFDPDGDTLSFEWRRNALVLTNLHNASIQRAPGETIVSLRVTAVAAQANCSVEMQGVVVPPPSDSRTTDGGPPLMFVAGVGLAIAVASVAAAYVLIRRKKGNRV